jgi:hypothetical protein
VHPYTFRNEAQYIAYDFNVSARAEYDLFYREMGIDGAFTVRTACLLHMRCSTAAAAWSSDAVAMDGGWSSGGC